MGHVVLVVDDQREARELVAGELAEAGFEVREACDGNAGWDSFRTFEPDLVVTDLRMPRCDGIDLLRRIRSERATPVILLTAYADVATAVIAMKSGASEFLTFPDDLDHMAVRIRELLDGLPDRADASGRVSRLREQRRREQRDELARLLEECRGNLAEIARRLELSRGGVIYRAQRFGLLDHKRPS